MHEAHFNPARNSRFRIAVVFVFALLPGLLLPVKAQDAAPVGVVKFVRGEVSIASLSGQSRQADEGDDLAQGERVVTGADSLAVILLADDSRMTLRPDSEFRVNRLDLDENSDDSASQVAVLNLLRGGLRLVTGLIGKLNPAGYRLSTPVATIGIRGTEFNSRICGPDCAAEESRLAGGDAAANVSEGLYVNVDEGRVVVENFAIGDPLELGEGEAGYVADLNSLPVKLALVPAFQSLDLLPSPGQLDFDNIEIPDNVLQPPPAAAEAVPATPAVVAVPAVPAAVAADTAESIAGTWEIDDISYGPQLPLADRRWFFGANPDIEFTLTQEGDNFTGEFEGDRDGTIKGKIDGKTVTFEFVLEAKGGEYKDGEGSWVIQGDGSLEGDFNIQDRQRGVIRGTWTLEKTD